MAVLLKNREVLVSNVAPGGVWAELGVGKGDFAAVMARRADVYELWLIDCWGPYPGADPRDWSVWDAETGEKLYLDVVRRFIGDKRVRIIRALIENAAAIFPEGYFDFVYIDAGHRYDAVRRHLELFFPLVRPGGLIAGHDYWNTDGFPHLVEVRRAVDQWCRERGIEIAYYTCEPLGSFGIVAG